jgi:nitric oxide reductase NorD protein
MLRPGDLLELDWEVGVFRAARALWRWWSPAPPPYDVARAAVLTEHHRALEVLAQLVAGEAVRVVAARAEGGVRGRDLLVPAFVDLAADPAANRGLLLLRVVHAAAMCRASRGAEVPPTELVRWQASAVLASEATAWLRSEMPAFGKAWDDVSQGVLARSPRHPRAPEGPPALLWGPLVGGASADATTGVSPPDVAALPGGTERAAPAVEELRRVMLDPKAQDEKVLTHTFEKVETLDSWEGNTLRDDGSDELDDHLEALQEVELRDLMRGGSEARSVYKADLDVAADIPDVERVSPTERGVNYDEWDHRAAAYRLAWCTVYATAVHAARREWGDEARHRHAALIHRLHRRLEDHRSRRSPLDRQRDGQDVDVDALVEHLTEVHAGRTGTDRLYVRQAPLRRDVATTVLLDVSLSSDSWVADRRVLDVSREAVLVLGEVAERLGDRLQVLAFASSTRNACRVFEVKGWRESWAVGRGRLGALEPQGYTRIGPALRHATRGLAETPADRRLLLLVSDGKPNDYDRYEGAYGVADVRMALREAARLGVSTHALAVDVAARAWLPQMLGAGGWHVVPRPDALLEAMTDVYGRATSR